MKKILFSFTVFVVSFNLAYSQTTLIGFGSVKQCSTSREVYLIFQKFPSTKNKCCEPPKFCKTNMQFPIQSSRGGAAWDPYLNGLWMTNGQILSIYAPKSCSKCSCYCTNLCKAPYYWYFNHGTYITGLAIDPYHRILYVSDTINYIYSFKINGPCSLKLLKKCKLSISPTYYITGLAYTCLPYGPLKNGVLFVAFASQYNNFGGTICQVEIDSNYTATCKLFCKVNVYPSCQGSFGKIKGIAFDPSKSILYATSGPKTIALSWNGNSCTYKVKCCCYDKNNSSFYHGLSLRYGGSLSYTALYGKQSYCFNTRACFQCSTTPATSSLPSIGNKNFKINFRRGPSPQGFFHFGFLAINSGGPCAGTPLSFYLCTRSCINMNWYTGLSPFPTIIGIVPSQGSGNCSLEGSVPLPIPCDPIFASASLCTQWLILNYNPGVTPKCCITLSKGLLLHIGAP